MRLPWLACTVYRPFFTIFWFLFPLWLALLRDWTLLDGGFTFLQSTLFLATLSCHTTLSFILRSYLLQFCLASLGLLFILLLMA